MRSRGGPTAIVGSFSGGYLGTYKGISYLFPRPIIESPGGIFSLHFLFEILIYGFFFPLHLFCLCGPFSSSR